MSDCKGIATERRKQTKEGDPNVAGKTTTEKCNFSREILKLWDLVHNSYFPEENIGLSSLLY